MMYQISVINNAGKIISVIKAKNVDASTHSTVFYQNGNNADSYRIYENLLSVQCRDKKVILIYDKCRAEIIRI